MLIDSTSAVRINMARLLLYCEASTDRTVQGITTTWASLVLDMAEYKATYKLRSTEEVFAALEDNMVTLSTMKASRFFAVFEKDITHWEKTLSLVSETVELVLTVSCSVQLMYCYVWLGAAGTWYMLVSYLSTQQSLHHSHVNGTGMYMTLEIPKWHTEADRGFLHAHAAGTTKLDVSGEHLRWLRRHPQAAAARVCHV